MNIAVIGAGVVGISTAYELALDGHHVTVFEKGACVAEGASFANGGLLAPSLVQPLSHPQWPSGALTYLRRLFQSVRMGGATSVNDLRWSLAWSKSRSKKEFLAAFAAKHALLEASLVRLHSTVQRTNLTFDHSSGQLVLLSSQRDAQRFAPQLEALKHLGVPFKALTPDEARAIETGLSATLPLHSAVHFPQDAVGNCRQFAQRLKEAALALGVDFRLGAAVQTISGSAVPSVVLEGNAVPQAFDRVVVCCGNDPTRFVRLTRTAARRAVVHRHSLSLHLREPLNGPRSAVVDAATQVTMVRIGNRIRVTGGAALGRPAVAQDERSFRPLYHALSTHFPGAANMREGVQTWTGSSLFIGDGLPLIGPTHAPGVFLNMGHGHNGWGMACGSARLLADLLGNRTTGLDASAFSPLRFGRPA
jgi:D-amino-acid dehydrogenase